MVIPEFVEPYPRQLDAYVDYERHRNAAGATNEDIGGMWSHRFGVLLHDSMSSGQPQKQFEENLRSYMIWNHAMAPEQLHLFSTPTDKLKARNESNFHALNRHMVFLWEPFITGWESEHGRKLTLKYTEHALAIEGFKYYLDREQYIKNAGGVHALYSREASDFLVSTAGVMLEFDVALAAVDVLLNHPDLAKHTATVVPAPAQFERTHKPRNVDFVFADHTTSRAVGLQSKLRVTEEDMKIADHGRVVLIDGSLDLEDVLALRADKGTSRVSVRAWPGIIAAKKILEIRAKGKGRSPYVQRFEDELPNMSSVRTPEGIRRMRQKMNLLTDLHEMQRQATLLTGHISLDQGKIRERIGSRIVEKL